MSSIMITLIVRLLKKQGGSRRKERETRIGIGYT